MLPQSASSVRIPVRIMRVWPKANASVQLQQRERLVWELVSLRQLVSHPHLGLLVGRSPLAEVLVQVMGKLQEPELLAAALDVLQGLLSTEALGSRRYAPAAVAAVTDRCLGLCRSAACALDAAFTATASSGSSSSRAIAQWRPLMEEQALALAAVGFLKGPLAALSQLPPEQRA